MPVLKINECVSCPYHKVSNYDDEGQLRVGEDSFYILCEHEEQENKEGRSVRISRQFGNICFKCPLEKDGDDGDGTN